MDAPDRLIVFSYKYAYKVHTHKCDCLSRCSEQIDACILLFSGINRASLCQMSDLYTYVIVLNKISKKYAL